MMMMHASQLQYNTVHASGTESSPRRKPSEQYSAQGVGAMSVFVLFVKARAAKNYPHKSIRQFQS
jgi:hypothetical protein